VKYEGGEVMRIHLQGQTGSLWLFWWTWTHCLHTQWRSSWLKTNTTKQD